MQLVSKAVKFLSVVVRMPGKQALFSSPQTLESFCERIILPNMVRRNFEQELFEDDPLEYLRRDIEVTGRPSLSLEHMKHTAHVRFTMVQMQTPADRQQQTLPRR